VFSGKKSCDRSENGQDRGAQRHPRNPFLPAVLSAVMNVLLQIFQRNFRFFHAPTLRSTLTRSRRNWSVEATGEVDVHVIVIATHGLTGWKPD
jgi:hypothetical protein